jgi:hypothetical protein
MAEVLLVVTVVAEAAVTRIIGDNGIAGDSTTAGGCENAVVETQPTQRSKGGHRYHRRREHSEKSSILLSTAS